MTRTDTPSSQAEARRRPLSKPRETAAALRAAQRAWARLRDVEVCAEGFVPDIDANLYRPLAPATRDELARRPEQPLGDAARDVDKPAELRRVHSRCALDCNFFDYWRACDLAPLCAAIDVPTAESLSFATIDRPSDAQAGTPDVLLEGGSRPTAIATRWLETYEPMCIERGTARGPLAGAGLPGCNGLAADLNANPTRFEVLPVGLLLRHGAALTRRFGQREFRLRLLWYEAPGPLAERMRDEIDRFRMRVGGEIDFDARSFQDVFGRLSADGGQHRGWADYVASRYFAPLVDDAA